MQQLRGSNRRNRDFLPSESLQELRRAISGTLERDEKAGVDQEAHGLSPRRGCAAWISSRSVANCGSRLLGPRKRCWHGMMQ